MRNSYESYRPVQSLVSELVCPLIDGPRYRFHVEPLESPSQLQHPREQRLQPRIAYLVPVFELTHNKL